MEVKREEKPEVLSLFDPLNKAKNYWIEVKQHERGQQEPFPVIGKAGHSTEDPSPGSHTLGALLSGGV